MNIKLSRRALSCGLAMTMLFGGAGGAFANALETIKQRGRIQIAVDVGHPPYGMLDDKAQQTGLDIDTAKLLAKDLGVTLEVVPVSGANRVPFLISNKVDLVIASFSITEERKKVISFSKPYGVIPVVILGPQAEELKDASGLDGKSVAVARGTTADIELTKAAKEKGVSANIVRYEDEATTNTAVGTGQQDYMSAALSTAQAVADQNPNRDLAIKVELAAYPMAIGMRQKAPELEAWVNEWITANLKNGELNKIYEHYFKQSLPEKMLNQ